MNREKQTNSNYQWIRRFVGFLAIAVILSTVANAQLQYTKALDFDDDDKADLSLIRNGSSERTWYTLLSSNNQARATRWGISGTTFETWDQVAPGDYDGDEKADLTAVRPSGVNFVWYILHSNGSGYRTVIFGYADGRDKIVPGDYDGDKKTDIAVVRTDPANPNYFVWYVLQSSNNQLLVKSVARDGTNPNDCRAGAGGDYDGDGKADFIQRSNINGLAYYIIKRSSDQTIQRIQWGLPSDGFVAGDYDGDGATDLAVIRYEGSNGIFPVAWYIRRSSDLTMQRIQWGAQFTNNYHDYPVPADYDGDGKTDVAVWRNSEFSPNGVYYILQSRTNSVKTVTWGIKTGDSSGDMPITDANYAGI
jgi:FG-GAP-like repeat